MNSNSSHHAIVLGGSLAGLMAARVLSRHFQKITIIEKDPVNRKPESRKSQPQTRHLHGLLPSGLQILCNYFPGLLQDFIDCGQSVVDFGASMNWYAHGGFKKKHISGIDVISISRPMLEHLIRERVLSLSNIELKDNCTVRQLTASADNKKVTGVVAEDKVSGRVFTFNADLVVDCTGTGSRTSQWLQIMGYEETPVTEVKIDVEYTTRIFKRNPEDPRGKAWMAYTPNAPMERRFGGALSIEGNRWMVTVGGWHGDHAPHEENEYLEFVKTLPNPEIFEIASTCEPLSEYMQYKFPVSIRRHFEKRNAFPAGYLVLGDAISSFNPIYGQGMSSACLQAAALDKVLDEDIAENLLAATFFKRVSKIIDVIWQLATGEDFRFTETIGKRPFGFHLTYNYIARIHKAAITDEAVSKALLKVVALMEPPLTLFHPTIIWRVLKAT